MTQAFYYFTDPDGGERMAVHMMSLADYEASGGEYDDSGNGGEKCEKSEFLAAVTAITGEDGQEYQPLDFKSEFADFWYDSVLPGTWWLLREWPVSAPLEARCNVS